MKYPLCEQLNFFPMVDFVSRFSLTIQNPVAIAQANEPLTRLISPESDSEPPKSFQDIAAAGSISTYPMDKESKIVTQVTVHLFEISQVKKMGSPICDRFNVSVYADHTVFCLCDGCTIAATFICS